MSFRWTLRIYNANWIVAEPAVINASPLIFLSRSDRVDLLNLVSDEIIVPATVAGEILRRGREDPTARTLAGTKWLRVEPDFPSPDEVLECDLGPGESAVLAWALTHPGSEAILDDLQARRCAARLGIALRGTLGIVLIAKSRGVIPAARPFLDELRRAGMYLSDAVLNRALAKIGE